MALLGFLLTQQTAEAGGGSQPIKTVPPQLLERQP